MDTLDQVNAIRDLLDDLYDKELPQDQLDEINKFRIYFSNLADELLANQLNADDSSVISANARIGQAIVSINASLQDLSKVTQTINDISIAANALNQIGGLVLKYIL